MKALAMATIRAGNRRRAPGADRDQHLVAVAAAGEEGLPVI
jgi:hypothetical protein